MYKIESLETRAGRISQSTLKSDIKHNTGCVEKNNLIATNSIFLILNETKQIFVKKDIFSFGNKAPCAHFALATPLHLFAVYAETYAFLEFACARGVIALHTYTYLYTHTHTQK